MLYFCWSLLVCLEYFSRNKKKFEHVLTLQDCACSSCVEVSYDKEFVFGVNLLQGVMQVAVEGLLYPSFSLLSRCVHTEDSGKFVVLDWEFLGT